MKVVVKIVVNSEATCCSWSNVVPGGREVRGTLPSSAGEASHLGRSSRKGWLSTGQCLSALDHRAATTEAPEKMRLLNEVEPTKLGSSTLPRPPHPCCDSLRLGPSTLG